MCRCSRKALWTFQSVNKCKHCVSKVQLYVASSVKRLSRHSAKRYEPHWRYRQATVAPLRKTIRAPLTLSARPAIQAKIHFVFPTTQQPLVGHGLLIIEASRSHWDTPHSVGILWTSDQPVAETSTWQHTTLTRDRHPCPRRGSNPQSQQASDCRPTP
jgi:hypothetical protein